MLRKLENDVSSGKRKVLSACSKCVIDFTDKKPEEIHQIFTEKETETICGRFYHHQLHTPDKSEQLKARFLAFIPKYFQSNRIAAAVFSLLLFLTGCSKQKETCTTTGSVTATETETDQIENQNFVMGEFIIPENDSTAKIHKPDSSAVKYRP
ncbi:hypothetical protein [Chryseobacterium sp. Leaf201]|uniref:hypothetical protein n=1 Tax=Chryseobacterium sp. Leaf201 TaxID=1735672 RepID=UPI0006F89935|nr:hypothetical protein [Chryseobacterium sp. Leaf201]KQM50148.1 hypothetical protein ASE55_09250 [Chryseobacterium sp. Leaf201]